MVPYRAGTEPATINQAYFGYGITFIIYDEWPEAITGSFVETPPDKKKKVYPTSQQHKSLKQGLRNPSIRSMRR